MAGKKRKAKASGFNNINYYETTGSAFASREQADGISHATMNAIEGNILKDKISGNANDGSTTPPNATSLSR